MGKTHVRANAALGTPKTTITPEVVASTQSQASFALDAGIFRFSPNGPQNQGTLVPRRSDPTEFRLFGTHLGGGGSAGHTSFPVDHPGAIATAQLSLPPGRRVVHAPDSPIYAPPSSPPPPSTLPTVPPPTLTLPTPTPQTPPVSRKRRAP